MLRILSLAAALVVAAALATGAVGQRSMTPTLLKGTVGPGYTISLTMGGKKVRSLKAGTYKISVSDKSSYHNFTLERETKPTIEKHITSTAFTGSKTITMKLPKGGWKYYCSVHEAMIHGTFVVR